MKTERTAPECSLFQTSGCVARVIAGVAVVFTLHILLSFSCCFNSAGLRNTKTPTESQKEKEGKKGKRKTRNKTENKTISRGQNVLSILLVFFQNSRVHSSLILWLCLGSTSLSSVIVTMVLSLFNGAGT